MKTNALGFDYEPIQGQTLKGVFGRAPLTLDDGSVAFDEIEFKLENCSIFINVKPDTDEVFCSQESSQESTGNSWLKVDALGRYVGCEIGWLWLATNWMGYTDMLCFSLSGINPSIGLIAIAAKLNLLVVERI